MFWLAEFDFEIKYNKGADNYHADKISRPFTDESTTSDDNDDDDILTFILKEKLYPTPDFINKYYEEVEDIKATEKNPSNDVNFQPIIPGKAHYHDSVFSDIRRKIDGGGETLSIFD